VVGNKEVISLDDLTADLLVPNRKTNSLSRGFGVIYKIRSTMELANLANRKSKDFDRRLGSAEGADSCQQENGRMTTSGTPH
jgi:hypothetical protein